MKLNSTQVSTALLLIVLAQAVAPYGGWYASVALVVYALVSYALDRALERPPTTAVSRDDDYPDENENQTNPPNCGHDGPHNHLNPEHHDP